MATPGLVRNIAAFFCCSGGKNPGPHIFPLGGPALNWPPDIIPYVVYGDVGPDGNWYGPAGNVEATGCTQPVAITSWTQARQEIASCQGKPPVPPVPPIKPPVPPITPPVPPVPPVPGPPVPPTPAPATCPPAQPVSCIQSADRGWAMDDCADADVANMYTLYGWDQTKLWDGQTPQQWWDTNWTPGQGTVLDRPLTSTPEG
jgi:hypothetical protein